jgi:hypothetical protein
MPGRSRSVPANFGENQITWTLTANGKASVIPASFNKDYGFRHFKKRQ